MTPALRFVQFNLLPSLAAGLVMWGLVVAGLWFLRIGYGRLRLSLLYAPVIKSLLVLLGIGAVLPWPPFFSAVQARAFGPAQTAPWLLVWLGGFLIVRRAYGRMAERQILASARSASEAAPRLLGSLQRAQAQLRECPVEVTGDVACCVRQNLPAPGMSVHDGVRSPLVIAREGRPAIVFPTDLVAQLSDRELDLAVAHELAHLMLRNPAWCSPEAVRHVSAVAPIAHLLKATLEVEEERACDDMAVAALGGPEVFSEMLLKSHRFARSARRPWEQPIRALPNLLGARPGIRQRVERQIGEHEPTQNLTLQAAATCVLWAGLAVLIF